MILAGFGFGFGVLMWKVMEVDEMLEEIFLSSGWKGDEAEELVGEGGKWFDLYKI